MCMNALCVYVYVRIHMCTFVCVCVSVHVRAHILQYIVRVAYL